MSARRKYEFEIWQDNICVVSGGGTDPHAVRSEMLHYALVYAQDGTVLVGGADANFLMSLAPPQPEPPQG